MFFYILLCVPQNHGLQMRNFPKNLEKQDLYPKMIREKQTDRQIHGYIDSQCYIEGRIDSFLYMINEILIFRFIPQIPLIPVLYRHHIHHRQRAVFKKLCKLLLLVVFKVRIEKDQYFIHLIPLINQWLILGNISIACILQIQNILSLYLYLDKRGSIYFTF